MISEQLWSLTKKGKLLNKKDRTGDWEHQDIVWTLTDGYIQDQNSSHLLALMDDVKVPGTRVILTTNTSDSAMWVNDSVYDEWFYLKPKGLDVFLTATSKNLTTVTGTDFYACTSDKRGMNIFWGLRLSYLHMNA